MPRSLAAMSVDEQADEPIAMAMAVALESCQHLEDLILGQVFSDAIRFVRLATFRGHWSHNSRFHQLQMT